MKQWWKPQSRYVEDLIRAMRNAFAMLGFMVVILLAVSYLGGK